MCGRKHARRAGAKLILLLTHLLHGNPIASLGRNLESLGRLLNGFLIAYNITHKKRAIATITIENTMANIASPKMVRLIAIPSPSALRWAAALSSLGAQPGAADFHSFIA